MAKLPQAPYDAQAVVNEGKLFIVHVRFGPGHGENDQQAFLVEVSPDGLEVETDLWDLIVTRAIRKIEEKGVVPLRGAEFYVEQVLQADVLSTRH